MKPLKQLQKLLSTLRIVSTLVLARTFGEYKTSAWEHDIGSVALYNWRGKVWAFPTEPASSEAYKAPYNYTPKGE